MTIPEDARGPSLEAGRQLILAHRPELAERELRRWLAAYPDSADGHALLGWSLGMQGRRAEALASAREAVRLEPEWAYTHVVLGELHLQFRQWGDAERCARAALEVDPGDSGGHVVLAASLLNQWWRAREALRVAEAGLALEPDDPALARLRAEALSSLRRHAEAREAAAYALSLAPEMSENHAAAGWIALAAGDGGEGGERMRQALRLNPANENARKGLRLATWRARTAAAVLLEVKRWKWLLCLAGVVYVAEVACYLAPRARGYDLVELAACTLCILAYQYVSLQRVRRRHPLVIEDVRHDGTKTKEMREARDTLVGLVMFLYVLPYVVLRI